MRRRLRRWLWGNHIPTSSRFTIHDGAPLYAFTVLARDISVPVQEVELAGHMSARVRDRGWDVYLMTDPVRGLAAADFRQARKQGRPAFVRAFLLRNQKARQLGGAAGYCQL